MLTSNPESTSNLPSRSLIRSFYSWAHGQKYLAAFLLYNVLMVTAQAQTGFATSEITNPIRNLVTIANAAIAGLAILAVIYYAIRWIGGDEGAAEACQSNGYGPRRWTNA